MRNLAPLSCVVMMVGWLGCVGDPSDPATWIKKLDDPRESKNAIRMLVKLKDKSAVPPLIEIYKKTKDPGLLKDIASFADPASVPVMVDSLEYSEESFEQASVAATALGEIGSKEAVEPLVKATLKPMPVKTRANVVKLEAMKSLAKIKDPRAVDALAKVLSTSADEQDFFLNQSAAKALSDFADPRAVPALVRGLFMTGRGTDIYPECRAALIAIGEPAAPGLVAAMQRKNQELEADAKKGEFVAGIIVQKTAAILGDLRAKSAIPALVAELAKTDEGIKAGPGKGVSSHQSILLSLGQIGDPSAAKDLIRVLEDTKAHVKLRMAAAEGLNLLGDPSVLPALLKATMTPFVNTKTHTIDGDAGAVVEAAATAYSRLAGPENATVTWQKLPADMEETEVHVAFKNADARLAIAKECKKDVACYEKYLTDKDDNKAEKAGFMLARLGKDGLAVLCKHVNVDNALARITILFGIGRLGDKTASACIEALDKQIDKDKGKPQPYRMLVQEMRAVRAQLTH